MAILPEAGIDVESARGRYGGYRLGRGTRLPPVVFTQDEALALVMAVLEGHPAAIGDGELAGSVLAKVIRALPADVGRQAATPRQHATAVPDRSAVPPDAAVTSALVFAVPTPPEGLGPVATREDNLGQGWEFPTRVVFEAPSGDVAPWIRPTMGHLDAHPDGCVLVGSTSNPAMYAQEWRATVPFEFRVEGGDELPSAVAALAARCAAAVSGGPGPSPA